MPSTFLVLRARTLRLRISCFEHAVVKWSSAPYSQWQDACVREAKLETAVLWLLLLITINWKGLAEWTSGLQNADKRIGIELGTFRLVAQCLNQLCHRSPKFFLKTYVFSMWGLECCFPICSKMATHMKGLRYEVCLIGCNAVPEILL